MLHQRCLSNGWIALEAHSPHLFSVGLRGTVSSHFCNLPKPKTQHSHPLQAAIGQLCGGEKGATVWTSFSSSNYYCHFSCEQQHNMSVFQERLSCLWLSCRDAAPRYRVSTFHLLPLWSFGTTINTYAPIESYCVGTCVAARLASLLREALPVCVGRPAHRRNPAV